MEPNYFAAAQQALSLGQPRVAEELFGKVAANSPEYPDALIHLAVLCHGSGRFAEAATFFSRLLAVRPGDAAGHCNLGECLRECGRLDDALRQLNLGVALDPDQPDAFNSIGLIHHAQGRLADAESAIRHALTLRPEFPRAMVNLGMVLQERRRLREAADWFRRALAIAPDDPMANSNLGQILVEIGRLEDLDEAERRCLKALETTSHLPHPVNNLGNVYRAMGRLDEAMDCYRRARQIAPGLAMPVNNMAQALQAQARFDEAAAHYLEAIAMEPHSARFHANYAGLLNEQEKYDDALARYQHAFTIDPGHSESCFGMGQVYVQLQKPTDAEAAFRRASELDPEATAPLLGLANLYAELGDFERAEDQAKLALAINPNLPGVYYQLASQRKGRVTEGDLQAMLALDAQKYLGEGARSQLNFGLGVVHDRRGDYAAAGRFFRSGNELQAQSRGKRNEGYDPDGFTSWIDRQIRTFREDLYNRLGGRGHASRRPIFVVGLPRSGTTLVEQILSSHSSVHGAGELTHINMLFASLPRRFGDEAQEPFAFVENLTPESLHAIAEDYLRELAKLDASAVAVVDKMPDNVNLLGFLRLLFPHARVVHCRRGLRDTALSCYQTAFGSIRWANDWVHIARRFKDYLRVVRHWRSLPAIEWLDFPYEAVIAEPEAQCRKLLDHVGLAWEPGCMSFHETRRQVRTASLAQVREPIYKTSVEKWRHYEAEMEPFLAEMGPEVDAI